MMTLSWRRTGASSALALAMVVGLPALAQAQLFPNLWIQRERTPCAHEPAFYAHVRQNYYGYFPTCWRKFPEGWACPCPNPELPNVAAEWARQPRDARPELPPTEEELGPTTPITPDLGGEAGPRGGPRGDARDLPPLPRSVRPNEDPFSGPGARDLTPPPGGDLNQPGGATPGRGTSPPPRGPFDAIQPGLPRGNGGAGSASSRTPLPPIDAPAIEQPAASGAAVEDSPPGDALAAPGDPVLALPAMSRPDGSTPTVDAAMPPSLSSESSAPADSTATPGPPAQAPRRPGMISGLFNRFRR